MSTESTVGSVPVGGFGAVAAGRPGRPLPYVGAGSDRARRASGALAVRRRAERRLSGVLDPWFRRHLSEQGFAGLADEFSNYNTPYLVLLWLATKLSVSQIVAIKLLSVIFDGLLAFFAYRIVRVVRPASSWLPVLITGLVLLLATVLLNSSAWGQCDAIYASLCLGSIYFLLHPGPGRPVPSSVWPSRSSSRRSSCCRCWWAS